MKSLLFLLATLLFFIACQSNEQANPNQLAKVPAQLQLPLIAFEDSTTQLYGFKDAQKNTIIKPQFAMAFTDQFSTFGYIAHTNGKLYAINTKGELMYEVYNYDNGPDYPSDGLFRIIHNQKFGYADQLTGQIVLQPQYTIAYPFENGLAVVCDSENMEEAYRINKKGQRQE